MGKKYWKEQTKKSRKAANERYKKRRDQAIADRQISSPVLIFPPVKKSPLLEEQVFKVTYICGHSGRFIDPAPHPHDALWCYRCCDYQRVVKVDQSVIRRPLRGQDESL